jgi:hypothetical protein
MNSRVRDSWLPLVAALAVCVLLIDNSHTIIQAQTTGPVAAPDLFSRVGLTADEIARATRGQAAVRLLPNAVDSEVAVAGAIRIRGDLERLVVWLKDMEQLRRALGTDVVGAIASPARAEDFSALVAADRELPDLAAYAKAYQSHGDRGIGALREPSAPEAVSAAFRDMLRRAVPVWKLAYDFAAYLEEYPGRRPEGIEDRFYWTRETAVRKPVATLHHVVMQRLPDRSVRFADKQFYASRDIEAALLLGQATPVGDGKTFDLVVSVRARVPQAGSLAGRLMRDRIGKELTDTFTEYLNWLQRSFALG